MDKPNVEYHEWLDDLAERKFYGDVTLHFQAGVIGDSMVTERSTAREIKDKMNAKRGRRVLQISKKGESDGATK